MVSIQSMPWVAFWGCDTILLSLSVSYNDRALRLHQVGPGLRCSAYPVAAVTNRKTEAEAVPATPE